MDKTTQTQIIKLIHQEVIPAIGCTEPVAVALAAAKAAEVLGCKPEKTEVFLSANILKNAMGVGIPGTGMVGLLDYAHFHQPWLCVLHNKYYCK